MADESNNAEGSKQLSAEEYETLLAVKLTDLSMKDFTPGRTFTFSVTDGYTLVVGKNWHIFLAAYGVDRDTALSEGNVTIQKDGSVLVLLKEYIFFKKRISGSEYVALKEAITSKFLKLLAHKVGARPLEEE